MKNLTRIPALPPITYPCDRLVKVKFRNWKYYRLGYIKKDSVLQNSYSFTEAEKPSYYRQISSAEPPIVKELEPAIKVD